MKSHDLALVCVGVAVAMSLYAWVLFFQTLSKLKLKKTMEPVDNLEAE